MAVNGAGRIEGGLTRKAGEAEELASAVGEDLEVVLARRARAARADAESAIAGLRRAFVRAGGVVEELDEAIDAVLSAESLLAPFPLGDGGRSRRAWRTLERLAEPKLTSVGVFAIRSVVADLSVELRRSESLLEDLGQHVLDLASDHDHKRREKVGQDLPPAVRRIREGREACRAWAEAVAVLAEHLRDGGR